MYKSFDAEDNLLVEAPNKNALIIMALEKVDPEYLQRSMLRYSNMLDRARYLNDLFSEYCFAFSWKFVTEQELEDCV